jgi:chromosome segregation ATPase
MNERDIEIDHLKTTLIAVNQKIEVSGLGCDYL